MRTISLSIVGALLLSLGTGAVAADQFSAAVVFSEAGFPAADSAGPAAHQFAALLPGARFAPAGQLATLLKDPATRLLVLPYGSAFPEESWPEIFAFLKNGGNLLVLGGRPFTRSAYHDATGWKLRDYSVRFARALMIDQYQTTPGSDGLQFQPNPDLPLKLPRFAWGRAFSPVIRLSAVDLYHRGGAAGSIDARLDPLAWGIKDGRKLAAPAIEIDHLRNGFGGGRWVFLNSELAPDFYSGPASAELVQSLADLALRGSEEFNVHPVFPLYFPGEPIQLEVNWHSSDPSSLPLTIKITSFPHDQPQARSEAAGTFRSLAEQPLFLPAPKTQGLHIIEAELLEGDTVRAIHHSGFWVRDQAFLRSGPRMTVNKYYFELDGQPLAVVGTTYMSREFQRLYFDRPNVYVWDQDLAQIHSAGLNMIRTGWWTGWDKVCDENGQPYERTLRTLEAYLMTARKNGLPVQFNFLAFLPDVLGGVNPYLDPEAVRRQKTLISSVVERFHDVPWLAWDLINEPSISQHLWTMRPNGDPIELEKWNEWLNQRYPDRAALAAAWNLPVSEVQGTVALPEDIDFAPRGMYIGHNSLKVYDYYLFAQDVFSNWVRAMRDAIRSTASQQLVTVGQDEGGIQDRLSPAYWGRFVDFTTNHSWWLNDYVLWDSLLAKQPGEAMLIQETGLQRELNLDETARRTPENEAALLERKIATSFIQGTGAIEWLWNTNSYMTESNETPIGAVLPDATEKPEATLLRAYAGFSKSLSAHLRNPQLPCVAIVTSQAAQFSVIAGLQLEAQQKAVRALAYNDRLTAYAIAENQIDKLGTPKLAILPSAQALTEKAWHALLRYANEGGNLLITGPLDYDEHWHHLGRTTQLKLEAQTEPLTYHNARLQLNDRALTLSFDTQKQTWLDALRFNDGSTLKEIPYGKGRIFWAAYPVELAEGTQPAADLYAYVAGRVGIAPIFEVQSALSPGVLIYPTVLEDSVMYVMVSDAAEDTKIDLRDKLTGARLSLLLPAQHAAIAVIGKREKGVVAKYGF
ncbi:MAG TPA: beta-galactosidase [Terriglobales bacterium]|nr:beta-galactosidase [Terriglobales bacterium]